MLPPLLYTCYVSRLGVNFGGEKWDPFFFANVSFAALFLDTSRGGGGGMIYRPQSRNNGNKLLSSFSPLLLIREYLPTARKCV